MTHQPQEGPDTSASATSVSLRRDLSLFDITMIGVGAMIGAGIFVLTGEAAGVAGPALILSFAFNGVVTVLTAMVYAELGSAIPEAGGGYLWIKEGLPGASAFLSGWMSWFAHAVAGALYSLGFGAFLYEILRMLSVPLSGIGIDFTLGQKTLGVLVALTFAYINFRGSSETGKAGNIVTVFKMIVVLAFCAFGIKHMFYPDALFNVSSATEAAGTSRLIPFIPDATGWAGILSAMGLTFIAFEGYEIIVQAGEEVVSPRRNVPKAIFLSLAIVVPTYMLVAFVLIGGTSPSLLLDALKATGLAIPDGISAASQNWQILGYLGELGLAQAAAQFIPFGAFLILIGGVLSTMSALNATTFSSTRVSFAMGRDRNLPDAFGEIHPRTRTPYKALGWTSVLICVMVAFVPITTVAAAADIMFLLLFLQVNVAAITLRKKYGDKLAYGYIMPFFPVVPILGIITELGLALFMFLHFPTAWLFVLLWLVAGGFIFRFYARDREREKTRPPIVAEERAVESKPHAILIPVADPESAKRHIRLGASMARKSDGALILLHVEKVPWQLPSSAASRFVWRSRKMMDDMRAYAEKLDVPASTMVRLARDPAEAIIFTAEETGCEFLIMGWQGDPGGGQTMIGRNIDRVLKESNCHVVVVQRDKVRKGERIVVPVDDPADAPLSLAVASHLRDEDSPPTTVLHLTEKPMSADEREAFRREIITQIRERGQKPEALFTDPDEFNIQFDVSRHPTAELVRKSSEFDRMVLGTSRSSFFGRKVFGRLPVRIARHAQCPVIFVRRKEHGIRFGIQRFFQFFRDIENEAEES